MKLKVLFLTLFAMLASAPAFAIPTSIIVTGQWQTTSLDENPYAPNGSQFRFDITPTVFIGPTWAVFFQYQAVTLGGSLISLGSMGSLDELTLTPTGNVSSVVINYIDSSGFTGGAFYLYPDHAIADFQLTASTTASAAAVSYSLVETPEPGSLALVSSAALAALIARRIRRRPLDYV